MNDSSNSAGEGASPPRHISQIHTDPVVLKWLTSSPTDLGDDVVTAARRRFFDRYCGPVYTFVRTMLSDPNATDEVVQQFAVRVMERSFRGYRPEKGRFRDYLKTTLRNMVTDYWRGVQRSRRFAGESIDATQIDVPDPSGLDTAMTAAEGDLEGLLERTFDRLRQTRQSARPTYYEVLNHVSRHPDQTSEAAAAALSLELALPKPLNAAALRQTLRRARERFRELLVEELGIDRGPGYQQQLHERLELYGILEFFQKED